MTKMKFSRGLMTAVIVVVFGLGYVCGSMTQRKAEAQIGGLLEKAGQGGRPGRVGSTIWFFDRRDAGPYYWLTEKSGYV